MHNKNQTVHQGAYRTNKINAFITRSVLKKMGLMWNVIWSLKRDDFLAMHAPHYSQTSLIVSLLDENKHRLPLCLKIINEVIWRVFPSSWFNNTLPTLHTVSTWILIIRISPAEMYTVTSDTDMKQTYFVPVNKVRNSNPVHILGCTKPPHPDRSVMQQTKHAVQGSRNKQVFYISYRVMDIKCTWTSAYITHTSLLTGYCR